MSTQARSAWIRATEVASLQRPVPLEHDGARRWDALESTAERMALVREIVAARAAELTLAYRNVVAVVAGYRLSRGPDGIDALHPEPCVVFMVRRKWPPGARGEPAQRLPERLLTFGPGAARSRRGPARPRLPYAVPTDVQPASDHAGARASGSGAVRVADGVPAFSLPGSLTCGVRLKGAAAGASRFLLSAMHVFSPVPAQAGAVGGADFSAIAEPGRLRGVTAAWGGHLDAQLGDGFDAQLAESRDDAWFNAAFAPLRLSSRHPFVSGPDMFDELAAVRSFRILVQEGQPHAPAAPRGRIQAQFSKYVGSQWQITYDVRHQGRATPVGIVHPELLLLAVHPDCPAPVGGDSGSAVVCDDGDGALILVGMYIARGADGAERDAYVLPAWQLFDPANWRQLPVGTTGFRPTFKLA